MNQENDFDKCHKIGILDIEASALDAQYGYLLAACIKTVNKDNLLGPTYSVRIDDPRNPIKQNKPLSLSQIIAQDKWVVESLVTEMNKYDLLMTWYGSSYDFPFINTRALKHNILPPNKNYRRDLYYCARGFGRLKSNKLVSWGSFLFGKSGKTFLNWSVWIGAMRGHRWALNYIEAHCKADVLETEKIYKRFIPLLGKLRRP